MKKASFASAKLELQEACMTLRAFTLGRHGSTQRAGVEGIKQVNTLCSNLKKRFANGFDAKEAARIEASGRACVMAAESRLALLRQ